MCAEKTLRTRRVEDVADVHVVHAILHRLRRGLSGVGIALERWEMGAGNGFAKKVSVVLSRCIATFVLLSQVALSAGCMLPMMGMHGAHEKEDSKTAAEKHQVEKLVSTLKRVEELISTQRILASQLPESDEKRELVDRLDRMKDEVQKLVKSWEGQAKPMQDMGRGGH